MYYNSAHWLVIIASSTSCVKKTAFLFLSELRQISTNFRCQSGWNCLNAPWLTNSRIEMKKLTHSTFWNRVRWTECVLEKYFSQFTENTIPKSVISEFWNFTLQMFSVEAWNAQSSRLVEDAPVNCSTRGGMQVLPLAIFLCRLPKLIKIRGNLTKFWQKQKCAFLSAWRVCIGRTMPSQDVCPSVRPSVLSLNGYTYP